MAGLRARLCGAIPVMAEMANAIPNRASPRSVHQLTALDEVIQRIGGEIYRRGSCLVSQEELLLIYDGVVEDSKRFACIHDIAIRYHWAFEIPGRMTSVTFTELPAENAAISNR